MRILAKFIFISGALITTLSALAQSMVNVILSNQSNSSCIHSDCIVAAVSGGALSIWKTAADGSHTINNYEVNTNNTLAVSWIVNSSSASTFINCAGQFPVVAGATYTFSLDEELKCSVSVN